MAKGANFDFIKSAHEYIYLQLHKKFTFPMKYFANIVISNFIAAGILGCPASAFAQGVLSKVDLQKCGKIENDLVRLACFDALHARTQGVPGAPPSVKGIGLWQVASERSKVDDSITSVTALLPALGPVLVGSKSVVPRAIARCQDGDLDFYISWGGVIGSTDHEVTIRLDSKDARVGSWSVSTDHMATFYTGDTKALLEGLANAKKLVARTTPQGENAVMATFNPSGFANVLPNILKACEKVQLTLPKKRRELDTSKSEEDKRLKDMELAKAQEEKLRKEIEIAKAEEERLRKEIEARKIEEEKRRKEMELAKAKGEEEQRQKAIEAAKALEAQRLREEQAQSERLRKNALERALKLAGTAVSTGDPNTSGLANSNVAPSADYGAKLRAAIRPNILSFKDLSPDLAAEYLVQTDTTALIVSAKLAKSSGNTYWDDVALKAILKTERLPKDIDGRTPSSIMLILRPQD